MSLTATLPNDHKSKGEQAAIASVVFTALAALVVMLKLFTRVLILRVAGTDDWLILIAMLSSIVLAVLTIEQVRLGLGKHFETLPTEEFAHNLKILWVSIIIYNLTLGLVKISILVQYLRIFIGEAIRITCYTILALVCIYTLLSLILATLTCYPIAYFWDKSIAAPHSCLNQEALWFSNASINILSHLAILVTPMPVLKSLQLSQRQKIGVMGIFALGGFTVVISILRLRSLYLVSVSTDVTWDNVGAATWSTVEVNVSIICACLPALKPLIRWVFPRLFINCSARYTSQDSCMHAQRGRTAISDKDSFPTSNFIHGKTTIDILATRSPEPDGENRDEWEEEGIQITRVFEIKYEGDEEE